MQASTPPKSQIQGASSLRQAWFQDQKLVAELNRSFDRIGFTDDYVEKSSTAPFSSSAKRKAIKDAVWGMIEFDATAMRLIDSPILQRMRRIRQLGFSYLTYPSAEHSRFIHSVGMANVVTRFIHAINRDQADAGVEFSPGVQGYASFADLKPLTADDVIHAALLHDVGHLPFSHVAEGAIVASPKYFRFGSLKYEEFQGKAEFFLKKSVSLSEALSLLVILSERFGRFYKKCVIQRNDDDALLRIACLIAGQRVHDHCPNIQHIISSSAVDADKIDYVTRDSIACGIPVGVDVSRVFLGSGILRIDQKTAEALEYGSADTLVFALNASGWDTFDEIIRARSTLYQRVYLHPVTRTAEALFARAIRLNATAGESSEPRLADVVALWGECDATVIDLLIATKNPEVSRPAAALRDRNLPKKACALSSDVAAVHMPICELLPETFSANQKKFAARENWTNIQTLIKAAAETGLVKGRNDSIDAVEFEDVVRKEANRIAEILRSVASDLVPKSDFDSIALIHIAALDSQKSNAPIFQNGEIVTADEFTNARGVVDATEIFRSTGYVTASEGWAELVLLATRRALYTSSLSRRVVEATLKPPAPEGGGGAASIKVHPTTLLDADSVTRRVGVSRVKLARVCDRLEQAGYFDDFPLLARRTEADATRKAADPYSKFDGEDGWRVTPATVAAFVDQFPPSLRHDLIANLEKGTYLSQSRVTSGLMPVLNELGTRHTEGLVLVPLSASSGGSVAAAVKAKINDNKILAVAELREALQPQHAGRHIVFVDDNAGSGTQSSAQLYQFAGLPRDRWPAALRKEDGLFSPLPPADLDLFRARSFSVAVALGHSAARARLEITATDVGFSGFSALEFGEQIGSAPWIGALRDYLMQVGRELIAYDRFARPFSDLSEAERTECDANSMGYSNIGGLTAGSVNVPTSTVTALWMPGMVGSRSWMPLFIRRGRLKNLIVA